MHNHRQIMLCGKLQLTAKQHLLLRRVIARIVVIQTNLSDGMHLLAGKQLLQGFQIIRRHPAGFLRMDAHRGVNIVVLCCKLNPRPGTDKIRCRQHYPCHPLLRQCRQYLLPVRIKCRVGIMGVAVEDQWLVHLTSPSPACSSGYSPGSSADPPSAAGTGSNIRWSREHTPAYTSWHASGSYSPGQSHRSPLPG